LLPGQRRPSGAALPCVNSRRKEGGTVFLEQIRGDGSRHEDNNAFQLLDYGAGVGLMFKF